MIQNSLLREPKPTKFQSKPFKNISIPSNTELLPMVAAVLDLKELLSYSVVLETSESALCSQETLRD
jgi:hypothetical protein